jgi:hypothetical protein
LIGLLKISKHSFLISITKRQQVAQIQGKPIYVVSQVALTPLASKAEADLSIAHTQGSLLKEADGHGMDESDTDDDEGDLSAAVSDDVDDEDLPRATLDQISSLGDHKRKSSIAEDVMTRKGGYGRFAQKWFSRKGWTVDQRRNLGMTGSNSTLDTPVVKDSKRSRQCHLGRQSLILLKTMTRLSGTRKPKILQQICFPKCYGLLRFFSDHLEAFFSLTSMILPEIL